MEGPTRRQMLAGAARASVGLALVADAARVGAASPAPTSDVAERKTEAVAEQVIDTLEAAYGRHRGLRRNHTKGVGARGTFVVDLR